MKMHNVYLFAGAALCAGGLATMSTGCELIAGVDHSQIDETGAGGTGGAAATTSSSSSSSSTGGGMGGMGGMGGAGGMGGMGGAGGMGGTGGAGGGGPVCLTEADCPTPPSECVLATCTNGACGTTNVTTGTPTISGQTAGDCKSVVCDGNGSTMSVNDDADVASDDKQCTQDVCNAGAPSYPPVLVGTACSEAGGKLCNDSGACVECNGPADCASSVCDAVSKTCSAPTCMDGVKNGAESDVDCGPAPCSQCPIGKACNTAAECVTGYCNPMHICDLP